MGIASGDGMSGKKERSHHVADPPRNMTRIRARSAIASNERLRLQMQR